MSKPTAVHLLQDALNVLLRAEVERAWSRRRRRRQVAGNACIALRAKVAGYMQAIILNDISRTTRTRWSPP